MPTPGLLSSSETGRFNTGRPKVNKAWQAESRSLGAPQVERAFDQPTHSGCPGRVALKALSSLGCLCPGPGEAQLWRSSFERPARLAEPGSPQPSFLARCTLPPAFPGQATRRVRDTDNSPAAAAGLREPRPGRPCQATRRQQRSALRSAIATDGHGARSLAVPRFQLRPSGLGLGWRHGKNWSVDARRSRVNADCGGSFFFFLLAFQQLSRDEICSLASQRG